MQKMIMVFGITSLLIFAGCAAIGSAVDKIAPSQVDALGNKIPGTHVATPITADTAGAIPYGSFALNLLLLAVNGLEIYKKNKIGKGLKSTIQAIEQTGEDPSMTDAIAKLKVNLSNAHQVAGVQPIINDILAKI